MIEKQPQILLTDAGLLEGRHFGAIERAHDGRVGVHAQAVQRVFREHHEVHGALVAPRLGHHVADALRLRGQIAPASPPRAAATAPAHHHAVLAIC
jgi:hypothetical protein